MAKLNLGLSCYAGGSSVITLNWMAKQSGGLAAVWKFRCVRNAFGAYPEFVLPSTPQFQTRTEADLRAWTWIDQNVPATGVWTYRIQVQKVQGSIDVGEAILTGQHFKR